MTKVRAPPCVIPVSHAKNFPPAPSLASVPRFCCNMPANMPGTDSTILQTFLNANGAAVSGDRLARELGISRVSVWSRLERLRKAGFRFTASTRVGYRMTKVPQQLHPALLAAHLRNAGVTAPLHCFDSIDSTNSEAERLLAAPGATTPLIVAAAAQTAGRGRMGRVWHSRKTGNAYLSLAFRPLLAPERMQAFTLAMGLRLCDFLATRFAVPLQIKWPNDLLCEGRKIAGILTEARVDADHVRDLVFGLGLNINSGMEDFPPELRDTAGSLALAAQKPLDVNGTAAEVIAALLHAYDTFLVEGRGDTFEELWRRYDFLAGKTVSVSILGRVVSGVVSGLDASGALLLRDAAGTVHSLNAGEVSLLKKRKSES